MVDFAELISKNFACGANNNHFYLSFIVIKAYPCKNRGKFEVWYHIIPYDKIVGRVFESRDKVGPEYCRCGLNFLCEGSDPPGNHDLCE